MKEKFHIGDYVGKRVVMTFKTNDDASSFLNYLSSIGRTWRDGREYEYMSTGDTGTAWDRYGECLCIDFVKGARGPKWYYEYMHYEFLEYENFCWDEFYDEDFDIGDPMGILE